MKKVKLLIFGLAICLIGCKAHVYTLNDWFKDAIEILGYTDNTAIEVWKKLLNATDVNAELYAKDAALMLYHVLNEEGENVEETMIALGYFTEEQLLSSSTIDQDQAKDLLEKAKRDLSTKTFLEDKVDITFKEEMTFSNDLENEPAGLYETEDGYYRIEETGKISEVPIEEVVEDLDIETTFRPDLSQGIIFPEGTVFQAAPSSMNYQEQLGIQKLKSKYFSFNIQDYKVSGRVHSSGLDLSLRKKDFFHGMDLENELTVSQLKITADVSLNPFKDPHFLLRADYVLNNTLSLSQKEEQDIAKKILTTESLENLKTRLKSLVKLEDVSTGDLELVRFSFPVPGTLNILKVEMVLKMTLLLNGEIGLVFETSANQGFQASKEGMLTIQENKWEVEPYMDGKTELSCQLGLDLKLKKYLLADIYLASGIGAQGKASVYFVDKKKKVVDQQVLDSSLTALEDSLSIYEMNSDVYIDTCADVDLYWFIRINIGASNGSLLRKVGFSQSYTPIKKQLRLLHIEHHKVVDECTRAYQFNDEKELQNGLQLSSYQLILEPHEQVWLFVEGAKDKTLKWQSSDEKVATVSDGLIEAHENGVATIVVQDEDGRQSSCVIIVNAEDNVSFQPLSSFFDVKCIECDK